MNLRETSRAFRSFAALLFLMLASGTASAQQWKLAPTNRDSGDLFGQAVSLDGDVAVLGAPYKQCPGGSDCGATMLFRFNGTSWAQEASPLPDDPASGDQFGYSVSVSGDLLLVGAPYDDCGAGADCGTAYVFRHVGGGSWLQEAKLIPSNRAAGDKFGLSVAIDGNVAVLGAPFKSCPGGSNCGATMLFRYNGSSWVQEAGPLSTDLVAGDFFGISVALSGNDLIVGSPGSDCAPGMVDCGAAYVFRHAGGGSWPQAAKLMPGDRDIGDAYGEAVDIHSGIAVLGAPVRACFPSTCGTVAIFRFNGSFWSEEAFSPPDDLASEDYFGISVGLSDNIMMVGASGKDCLVGGTDCGAAYVFRDMGAGSWVQTAKLLASDAASGDSLGCSVSASGMLVLAGASGSDCMPDSYCGAAYVFDLAEPPPIQSNLIGYWKLDGNYADLSPGHRDLTPEGGIVFGPGVLGEGAALPSDASRYLHRGVDDDVYNFGGGNFTISVWVYFQDTSGEQVIIEKWTGPSSPGWTFTKLASQQFQFEAAGLGVATSAPQSISLNSWHHLVIVRSGPGLNIWLNNTIIAGSGVSGAITASDRPLLIGRRDGGQLFPMHGRMDEIAIWSRALSGTEIADLYTAHQMICGCATQPSGFAGGDGTPGNPYQVCSPLHLDNVRNHLSSHFIQTADIDMTGVTFMPIGDNIFQFVGQLNGNGFAVSHLNINLPSSPQPVGLIGYLATPGLIENVSLRSVQIVGLSQVGALVGYNQGVLQTNRVSGTINGVSGIVGGLSGYNTGSAVIEDCLSEGSVAGTTRVGGLTGELTTGTRISNSYSRASVSSSTSDVIGGLIGILRAGAIVNNTYSTGAVSGVGARVGGLVGLNQGTTVSNSFWDIQTSGLATSDGGVGKTTAEMQMQSTFDPPWDFVDVWEIDEGNDYPRLRSESVVPPGLSETSCTNQLDDDCDSFVDCDDMECSGNAACAPPAATPDLSGIDKTRFVSFVTPSANQSRDREGAVLDVLRTPTPLLNSRGTDVARQGGNEALTPAFSRGERGNAPLPGSRGTDGSTAQKQPEGLPDSSRGPAQRSPRIDAPRSPSDPEGVADSREVARVHGSRGNRTEPLSATPSGSVNDDAPVSGGGAALTTGYSLSGLQPENDRNRQSAETALRVNLVSLHHVDPPYTGGVSVPFTSFEGQVRWVGPPTQYVESTSNATPFYAAVLQCTPHYQDWSTVGLLHVTGSAIVPNSIYEVENVAASCMGIEASCTAVSAPLTVSTTRWGDVETPYNPPSSTVQPDVGDIGSLVNKFRSAPGAPIKARALLAGNDSFGNITSTVLGVDFDFSHIAACVDAFRGRPYPYTIQACP